jgi:hypothetical protein
MRTVSLGSWLGLLLFGAAAWNAGAAEPTAPAVPPAVVTATAPAGRDAPVAAAQPHYVDGLGQSVGAAALAGFSGGTAITEEMTLNGTVANNSDDHLVTGANAISSGSFNGAAGVPMVIQNTGNNVLIQNATIINVQFQP